MVAGQVIDPAEVAKFAASASLVIARNAAFDRRFLERYGEVRSHWLLSLYCPRARWFNHGSWIKLT